MHLQTSIFLQRTCSYRLQYRQHALSDIDTTLATSTHRLLYYFRQHALTDIDITQATNTHGLPYRFRQHALTNFHISTSVRQRALRLLYHYGRHYRLPISPVQWFIPVSVGAR